MSTTRTSDTDRWEPARRKRFNARLTAEQDLRDHEVVTLSARDSRIVMDGLLHSEAAGPALRSAADRYRARMGDQ